MAHASLMIRAPMRCQLICLLSCKTKIVILGFIIKLSFRFLVLLYKRVSDSRFYYKSKFRTLFYIKIEFTVLDFCKIAFLNLVNC